MGKLKLLMKSLVAVCRDPKLLSAVVHSQRYWKSKFESSYGHDNPMDQIAFGALVPGSATLGAYDFGGDTSMVTDLLLLTYLSKRGNVKRYAEIGTWRGSSAAAVAPNVDEVVTIDLDRETMRRRNFPEHVQDQIGMYVRGIPNVRSIRSDTRTLDFSSLGGPFDLVFIDGDHRAEFVAEDTRNVLKHLCHDSTIIVWHDYGIDPENVRWEVYYGICAGLPNKMHSLLRHVECTKCCVLGLNDSIPHTGRTPDGNTGLWSIQIDKIG